MTIKTYVLATRHNVKGNKVMDFEEMSLAIAFVEKLTYEELKELAICYKYEEYRDCNYTFNRELEELNP